MKASRPSAAADFVTCRRVTPAAPAKGFGRFSRTARVLSVFVSRLGKWRARRAARARWMRREGDGTAAADRAVRSDASEGYSAAATADPAATGASRGPCFTRSGALCRSEEHTSELQSPMRISYALF